MIWLARVIGQANFYASKLLSGESELSLKSQRYNTASLVLSTYKHIMKGIKMKAKSLSSLIAAIFVVSSFSAVAADAMAPAGATSPTEAATPAKHKPVRHKKEAKKQEKKEEAAENKKEESRETPAQEKKEELKAPKK